MLATTASAVESHLDESTDTGERRRDGRMAILVTDGDERAALAIVRSLGSAGYRCIVGSTDGHSLAGASRFAEQDIAIPDPASAPDAHVDAVEILVRDHDIDLIIPVSEAALLALLPARERVAAILPFPDTAVVQAICDKARVLEAARSLGIRVPRQSVIASAERVTDLDLPFPVVLKPARSVFTAPDGSRGKVGVAWADSEQELRAALRAYPEAAYPVLAQEVIVGPGIGIFLLIREGRVVARFAHRRIREKPPSGGVSVLRQSEDMHQDLLTRSSALLSRFGWSGVAMVEYKQDLTTGDPVLMEINGRFWGSLQLAIDAGVDFPRVLVELSLGRTVRDVESYHMVRSRWFWGDVDHVIACWRGERYTWRQRFSALAGWLRAFGPGYRAEVFRWSDPHPFMRETARWLRNVSR